MKKAEAGDAVAQSNLGYRYYFGIGVTQDYKEAVKWYRKSAEHGYADAKKFLEEIIFEIPQSRG